MSKFEWTSLNIVTNSIHCIARDQTPRPPSSPPKLNLLPVHTECQGWSPSSPDKQWSLHNGYQWFTRALDWILYPGKGDRRRPIANVWLSGRWQGDLIHLPMLWKLNFIPKRLVCLFMKLGYIRLNGWISFIDIYNPWESVWAARRAHVAESKRNVRA